MKKITALFLALYLLCVSAAVLAEGETETVEIPPQVAVEDVSAFYGTWIVFAGSYNGMIMGGEDLASLFGGTLPIFQIDETNITSINGEGDEVQTESHPYTFNAEGSQLLLINPETNIIENTVCMLEDGSIQIDIAMGDEVITVYAMTSEELAK